MGQLLNFGVIHFTLTLEPYSFFLTSNVLNLFNITLVIKVLLLTSVSIYFYLILSLGLLHSCSWPGRLCHFG